MYELDLAKGKCRLIADDILDLDFDPDARYWAASENNKGITHLGPKAVWSRQVWVGDTKTGKQWIIAENPIHTDSVSVQPAD